MSVFIDFSGLGVRLLSIISMLLLIGNIESNPGPNFSCHICNKVFASSSANIMHQKIHSNERNFQFKCPHSLCLRTFSSHQGLFKHLNDHQTVGSEVFVQSNKIFKCNFGNCHDEFQRASDLCHHLLSCHRNESKVCPFSAQCGSTAPLKPSSFASHLSIKHTGWKDDTLDAAQFTVFSTRNQGSCSAATSSCAEGNFGSGAGAEIFDIGGNDGHDDNDDDGDGIQTEDDDFYYKHIIRFYLSLEAEKFLSESAVQYVAQGLKTLSEIMQQRLKQSLERELKRANVAEKSRRNIIFGVLSSNVFYNAHHVEESGPSFTSTHLRQEYIKKNFDELKFQEKPLSVDHEDGPKIFYFPVEDTLNCLLKDETIQDMIEDSFVKMKNSTQDQYKDYGDGRVHQQCRCQEDHIELIIFQDGFSFAKNALGSAAKKLKMVGTYFTIGNLPPHIRSKEVSMNLCFLVEDAVLKAYSPNKVFEHLVAELKKLETTGVKFKNRTIPVKLSFIVGDNLGSHQVGGFTECFSGKYFCRFCEITRQEFHSNIVALKALRRKEDVSAAIEQLAATNQQVLSYKGVKFESEFNELEGFHVADPRLPPCLGHDLFEGAVSWDLKAMLLYFESKGWFTLKQLSSLIDKFAYQRSDARNKPAEVKVGKITLGGHAVQNWTLLRLLPFILEKRIKDPKDEVWQQYLLLKKIVEFACSPQFTRASVSKFNKVIKKYLRNKMRVMPDSPLKPKHHYLLHYPILILQCGPLIHLWAMR